ncbi:hypothetical protein G7Y89_g15302 [Cudoniella acicularis]|uniref:CCHC-type domain-containing protein n=1 Tax=Cudoniella acicularis TaxID=354080 RepID=A0A8H4QR00_9HELO|nr:hypothetical protein G7Y89_g15302 [Cudoniella acicularis]
MASISFKGEKLVGKSNYVEWLIEAKLYLKVNGFMPYIDGSIKEPNKGLYYKSDDSPKTDELAVKYEEKLQDYMTRNSRALAGLQSIISSNNIARFSSISTAKELWDKLKRDFGESSLELVGRYYNKIVNARYSNFKSIDEYISEIQSSAQYLEKLGHKVSDVFILVTIYNSLPSSFDAFTSRKYEEVGNKLDNINLEKLVSDLIAEEARMNSKDSNLEANKASINSKPICTHCNKTGHLKNKCWVLHPELKKDASKGTSKDNNKKNKNKKDKETKEEDKSTSSPRVIMSASLINTSYSSSTSSLESNKLVLDSGASEHFSPNKDWFLDYKELSDKTITVANKAKVAILGKGSIPLVYKGQELLLKEVYYVPSLATTLISAHALSDNKWDVNIIYNFDKRIVESTRDITIKEDLEYKKDYKIQEDYKELLAPESEDYDSLLDIIDKNTSRELEREATSSPLTIFDRTPSLPPDFDLNQEEDASEDASASVAPIESSDDEEESRSLRPRREINYSTRRPYNKANLATLDNTTLKDVYEYASSAYLATKIEGVKEEEEVSTITANNKIIIKKPSGFILEPKTYEEAISKNNPYKDFWIRSMQGELNTLETNNTWELISEPLTSTSTSTPLKTRWVYKIKDLRDGNIELKSRFVAKGFEQLYGRDYLDSYAAVIKQIAWKLVFALAILNNLYLYKIDIVSAFTHGDIDTKGLSIKPPKGLGTYLKLESGI